MSSESALAVAAQSPGHAAVAVAADQGFAVGDEVTVTAADYAHDEVAGKVVGLDGTESVIERRDGRAGVVHVHFPRIGFHIKAVRKEGA